MRRMTLTMLCTIGGMPSEWNQERSSESSSLRDFVDTPLSCLLFPAKSEHGSIYSNGLPVRAVMNVGFLVLLA